jgi:hypothetical protein
MQDNDDAAHRPGLPLARGCQKIVGSGGEACRMRRGKESHRRIQRQESIGLDRRLQNSRLLLPRRSNVAPLLGRIITFYLDYTHALTATRRATTSLTSGPEQS